MFTQLYDVFATWFPSMLIGLGGLWNVFTQNSLIDLISNYANGLDAGVLKTFLQGLANVLDIPPFNEVLISFTFGAGILIFLAITFGKWTLDVVK